MSESEKKKALEFVKDIPYVNLATVMDDQPYIRLMHWSRIEDDFTIWLSTMASSNKTRHIRSNPRVCAMFVREMGYLRVFGKVEIVNDQKMKDELWEDQWDLFWTKGKKDPDYVLLKITAESVDYLDMTEGDTVAHPVSLSD